MEKKEEIGEKWRNRSKMERNGVKWKKMERNRSKMVKNGEKGE